MFGLFRIMKKDDRTYITKEGLKKLKTELRTLKISRRKEIAECIQEAKELGDLSENAEYVEIKNEQAFIEGRILELENIIKNAIIIEKSKNNGRVTVGSTIKIRGGGEEREYVIVGSNEADPATGKISNESPIGQAFINKVVGEIIEIEVPRGVIKFEIIEIR